MSTASQIAAKVAVLNETAAANTELLDIAVDTAMAFNSVLFWGENYVLACTYYALAFLTPLNEYSSDTEGAMNAGPIISKKNDAISAAYAQDQSNPNAAEKFLRETTYGRMYLTLLNAAMPNKISATRKVR